MDQMEIVMERFKKGRLRRPGGKKITEREDALAVGMSEERAAKERGTSMRTYMGDKRRRPNLKKKKEK
jgi:hypothetical protein